MVAICHLDRSEIENFFKEIKYKSPFDSTPIVEQAFGFIAPDGNIIYTNTNNASHHMLSKEIIHKIVKDHDIFIEANEKLNDDDLNWEINEFYSAFLKEQGYIAYRMFSTTSINNKIPGSRLSIKYYKSPTELQIDSATSWLSSYKHISEKYTVNTRTTTKYTESVNFLLDDVFYDYNYKQEYNSWLKFYNYYKYKLELSWNKKS
jgi:coproporphyrinogen III oxidase-like Fe-S oxidoreductase